MKLCRTPNSIISTKFYCFRARVHCYYCLYVIFLANPVRHSEGLRGGPIYVPKRDVERTWPWSGGVPNHPPRSEK